LTLGCALENLSLAAHSLGLATVHIGNFDPAQVAPLLDIPQGFEVEIMTVVGYADEEPAATARKPLEEIAFNNRFGASITDL
jgi:nitroreductase